jgi:probable HAF family extracellular repeat protein
MNTVPARRRMICWVLSVCAALTAGRPGYTAGSYAVIDVTTFEQAAGGIVRGLSSAGHIVGTAREQSGQRGFRVGPLGIPNLTPRLERLDGFLDGSAANAINELGAVAGASNTATAVHAFRWTPVGGFLDLGTLPGDISSEAWGINRHNDAVGFSSGPRGIEAVLWQNNAAIQGLGRLRDGDYSRAYAVNQNGAVAGTSGTADFSRAFIWTDRGGMEDLGPVLDDEQSFATGINDAGTVVGYSRGGAGERAFIWSRNTGMVYLGAVPGGGDSRALAINEPGNMVGTSASSSGSRAVLWTRGGDTHDLNTLIPTARDFVLTEAVSITSQGWILAIGRSDDGTGHGHADHEAPMRVFLLRP